MNLPVLSLPTWADELGEDRSGVFARFRLEGVLFVFRWIPPGGFRMGSPPEEEGRYDDEGPAHTVGISTGFWLADCPLTKAQWTAVNGEEAPGGGGDQHPVTEVDWQAATDFAVALDRQRPGLLPRLPTEAEWEYACRAGTSSAFNNGADCTVPDGEDPALNQLGWYDENSSHKLQAVRQLAANAWGLYDTHGNVWEWCLDGLREYEEGTVRDPVGPLGDAGRVVRGGSWSYLARLCRSACRGVNVRVDVGNNLGLRLAAGQVPPEAASSSSSSSPAEQDRAERGGSGAGGISMPADKW